MKIKLDKYKYGYIADFSELSGSPITGDGKTEAEAVAALFIRNIGQVSRLDLTTLEINGKPYRSIYDDNKK